MTIEQRREWSKYFEELDNSRRYEIELEKAIIEQEREQIITDSIDNIYKYRYGGL